MGPPVLYGHFWLQDASAIARTRQATAVDFRIDDGGYFIGRPEMRQSSRGFAYKFAYRIRIYSFAAKFAAKFIANLALFLSHAAKFTTRENTGSAVQTSRWRMLRKPYQVCF